MIDYERVAKELLGVALDLLSYVPSGGLVASTTGRVQSAQDAYGDQIEACAKALGVALVRFDPKGCAFDPEQRRVRAEEAHRHNSNNQSGADGRREALANVPSLRIAQAVQSLQEGRGRCVVIRTVYRLTCDRCGHAETTKTLSAPAWKVGVRSDQILCPSCSTFLGKLREKHRAELDEWMAEGGAS